VIGCQVATPALTAALAAMPPGFNTLGAGGYQGSQMRVLSLARRLSVVAALHHSAIAGPSDQSDDSPDNQSDGRTDSIPNNRLAPESPLGGGGVGGEGGGDGGGGFRVQYPEHWGAGRGPLPPDCVEVGDTNRPSRIH
jgi:hypothetical protein